jgi:hypothetical protein
MSVQRRGRLAVAAIALLVIGAALGITADRLHHRRPHVIVVSQGQSGVDASLELLDSLLALTDKQRTEIQAILAQRQGPIDSIWMNTHIALRSTLDSTADAVARVLDENQKTRFNQVFGNWHTPPRGRHPH